MDNNKKIKSGKKGGTGAMRMKAKRKKPKNDKPNNNIQNVQELKIEK